VSSTDDPQNADRTEQQAVLEAALFPVVSRALEARRGSSELLAWIGDELRRGGAEVAAGGGRETARRLASGLARLVAESGFAGPLNERILLTIRARKVPDGPAD
jgi:hypothetical protein